jgi:hypothetical protein
MDRKQETKIVKEALAKVGIVATVKHGTGTAWGWLKVRVKEAPDGTSGNAVLKIIQGITGRHGDHDGCIGVCGCGCDC